MLKFIITILLTVIFICPAFSDTTLYTSYMDTQPKYILKDGQYTGYGHDIVRELNKRLVSDNIQIKQKHANPQLVPRKRLFRNLSIGNIQIYIGMGKSKKRSNHYKFIPIPSLFVHAAIAKLKTNNFKFKDLKSLAGKKLVLINGSKVNRLFDKINEITIYKVNFPKQGHRMIATNRVDFMYHEYYTMKYALQLCELSNNIDFIEPLLNRTQLYIGLNKNVGDDTVRIINHRLKEMDKDGTITAIMNKYH